MCVLTACFYGDALKFAKKASLNRENNRFECKSVRQPNNWQHSLSRDFIDCCQRIKFQIIIRHTLKYVDPGWNVNENDFFGIL